MSDPSRRSFLDGLVRTAGALTLVGCGAAPEPTPPSRPTPSPEPSPVEPSAGPTPLPDGLDRATFHVHNERPLALEVRRSALGAGVITPLSRFFVRNNLPRPDDSIVANPLAWSLQVEGVARPGSITVAQLQQLGMETVATVIQCSGNGRAFFEHGPSGSPWATGAAGCALWTGVRVADVLAHFGGVVGDARFLTATGGEVLPEGVDRDTVVVERSVPVEKALKDCLLVWEMNGAPLPISHGGPLRLVVPGYYGCNQIKYVARIAGTAVETTAKIQQKGYRFRPIGEKGSAAQPTMWRMPVKSWVVGPGADDEPVLAGRIWFHGFAFSGERGVSKVEVSLDDGTSWKTAELVGPDLGPNAWRAFRFQGELKAGAYRVASRATDTKGEVQPEVRVANERGYGHTGWRDHTLAVTVVDTLPTGPATTTTAPAPASTAPAPSTPRDDLSDAASRGRAVFTEQATPSCTTCHALGEAGAQGTVGPNLDVLKPDASRIENAVRNGVGAMPPFDATLSAEQIRDVATYVTEVTKP